MSKHSFLHSPRQSHWRVRSKMRGITLLELMTVVVIVGILAAVALPNYRAYTMRAQRVDATAALLRVGAAQEKFYLQNNTYATTIAALNMNGTERGFYTLSILPGANATGFTAQATAPAASGQFADSDCRTFSLNETGLRTAVSASGANTTGVCWR